MKNLLKTLLLISIVSFTLMSVQKTEPVVLPQENDGIEIKGKVKEIIEAKCMGCHKPDSRNEKAKEKLQWAKVPEMDAEQQKDFVNEMFEVLEDGKMPPKKALERRPQMKLTEEETEMLLAWMEKEEKRIKGK